MRLTQLPARCFLAGLALALLVTARPASQDLPLFTSRGIAAQAGGERDLQSIVAIVFTHAFRNGSRDAFFLDRQLRREWLPSISGVEFQLLADADVANHVRNCGLYWEITQLERAGDTVTLELRQRCGCRSLPFANPVGGFSTADRGDHHASPFSKFNSFQLTHASASARGSMRVGGSIFRASLLASEPVVLLGGARLPD